MAELPEIPEKETQKVALHRKIIYLAMAVMILLPLLLGSLRLLGFL